MSILAKLFGSKRNTAHGFSDVFPAHAGGSYAAGDLDLYYSSLREDRPYVVAMREVAVDAGRPF